MTAFSPALELLVIGKTGVNGDITAESRFLRRYYPLLLDRPILEFEVGNTGEILRISGEYGRIVCHGYRGDFEVLYADTHFLTS